MSGYQGNGLADTPEEEVMILHVLFSMAAVLAGSAAVYWLQGAEWLVAHHVLAPAAAGPAVRLPGAGGAGLDAPRLAIAAAALLAVLAVAASSARRAAARRREPRP